MKKNYISPEVTLISALCDEFCADEPTTSGNISIDTDTTDPTDGKGFGNNNFTLSDNLDD